MPTGLVPGDDVTALAPDGYRGELGESGVVTPFPAGDATPLGVQAVHAVRAAPKELAVRLAAEDQVVRGSFLVNEGSIC